MHSQHTSQSDSHADPGGHDHDHHHDHHHEHSQGLQGILERIPLFHSHSHGAPQFDSALESNERGIWALKISLIGLGLTALFQAVIALSSGSVGLLADTIHNFSDALTAIPLWLAFTLARRPANRRYTYGYGRTEDIAGVVIVGMILLSAVVALVETYQKFVHPQPLRAIGWVMVASFVGFAGNEVVGMFRIRVGKEIGSAALIADGEHARIDGFTSLAVLLGALGVLLGFPMADPLVGLLITLAILFIVKDTALTMWHRMMDAIEPEKVAAIEHVAREIPQVQEVSHVRVRWLGHRLQAELQIVVDGQLSTLESHTIAEEVRHRLYHELPQLASIMVHVDPCGNAAHRLTAHHEDVRANLDHVQ